MSDETFDEFADDEEFLREARSAVKDLSYYAVAQAAAKPDVLEWVDKVATMAAEFRVSKSVGFSDDHALSFLYMRHLSPK